MSHEIHADYRQRLLIAPSLQDWVDADHPARFIGEVEETGREETGKRETLGDANRDRRRPKLRWRLKLPPLGKRPCPPDTTQKPSYLRAVLGQPPGGRRRESRFVAWRGAAGTSALDRARCGSCADKLAHPKASASPPATWSVALRPQGRKP